MSDPATAAAPAPVSTDPVAPASTEPKIVTEVDIPDDGGFPAPEPELATTPAAAASDPAPAEPAPVKKTAFQTRIDTVTAQREAEKRQKEEALRERDLYKAMAEGKGSDPATDPVAPAAAPAVTFAPGSPEWTKAVKAEAAELAAAEVAKGKMDGLLKAGRTEFKDFDDRCNMIASLGAGDRGDFMQIMTDPTIITDGQKVIAQLADNPDEAARILALPTVQMTAALVKFQAESSKSAPARPLSNAPAPIRTIDGVSKGNDEPSDKDDMKTYAAKYQAQQAARLKERQPSRFAKH